jgi:von Willebrand factor type A domain
MNAHRHGLVRFVAASALGIAASASCGSGGGSAGGTADGGALDPNGGLGADAAAAFGNVDTPVPGSADASCASSFVQAHALPLMLVFMFDRSDSMNDVEDEEGGPGESKWDACVAGLEAFFGDPSSAGIAASLQFFMQPDECDVNAYATPEVPMTALPAGPVFDQAFAATTASGETPTVPALQGALAFATETEKLNPGAKVAVVFVTDGEPNGCKSTIADAADAAAAAHGDAGTGTPTYVVGIGKVKSLDAIASAGGTGKAFIVSTSDPEQTAVDFRTALGTIRGASLGCEYPIPPAPAGQTLDFDTVNVVFTPSGRSPVTLPYDKDCSASGWRYDDPQDPGKIEICPAECTTVEGDRGGSVGVELGCATVGGLR